MSDKSTTDSTQRAFDLPICDSHLHLFMRPGQQRFSVDELASNSKLVPGLRSVVYVESRGLREDDSTAAGRSEVTAASNLLTEAKLAFAIVGWVDIRNSVCIERDLDALLETSATGLRGIRYTAGRDPLGAVPPTGTNAPLGLYREEQFTRAARSLGKRQLSMDVGGYHMQLRDIAVLADSAPDTIFILNHCGGRLGVGPYAADSEQVCSDWSHDIRMLAQRPNVWAKIGGLGMPFFGFDLPGPRRMHQAAEAWRPVVTTVIEAFGANRCMFESNYPVDSGALEYHEIWGAFSLLSASASQEERHCLFAGTGEEVYRIDLK